jgi:hypothetical protein
MSYLSIDNLYKNRDIFLFKECYAMEKIHGTSAHISWKTDGSLSFFAGGANHAQFKLLFNEDFLKEKFLFNFIKNEIVVFGEAYGGKCQGMSKTYGPNLKFVAFEVRIDEIWLNVPNAESVALTLGLEFVHYRKITTDIQDLDKERLTPSEQAFRNGISDRNNSDSWKMREGIVLRPLYEFTKNGNRVISKYKNEEFSETKTPRPIDSNKLKILDEADEVAIEWVTRMRLEHVLDKLRSELQTEVSIEHMGLIIKTMIEDISREGVDEIINSKEVRKAVGKRTAILFKEKLSRELKGGVG